VLIPSDHRCGNLREDDPSVLATIPAVTSLIGMLDDVGAGDQEAVRSADHTWKD